MAESEVKLVPVDPKDFEIAVADLLRLCVEQVHPETLIGHKKVDLYFEERRLGSVRRVVVECKSSRRPLDQQDLTTIYSNYRPLLDANRVDDLLVVTYAGLTPSASAMVRDARGLSHLRFDELQCSIMDFRSYLGSLVYQFSENGLSDYYIPLNVVDGSDLEKFALKWIKSGSSQPVAILGSYGMGKTTFARRLASVLAETALRDSQSRIPILVRLGDISSEQSLEGLLGKLFTATHVVRNYNFGLLMRLNELGRFVIFLDGFDEMKHNLSWDEFKFNFRQINRLVTLGSRVILLGRPTAFMNDEEHQHALHGIRSKGGKEVREPDWPDYSEIYLASFNREQVSSFLRKYIDYKVSSARSVEEEWRFRDVRSFQIDKLSGKQFYDIARRPVQLKMLAEILPQWKGDVSNITVTLLYSLFIDLIIEREQEKISRRRFDGKARREFAGKLAFWLWTTKKEMSITADDIPESILVEYCRVSDDIEEVRRDLVSACFLDKKIGASLYFPHRSFQEFLLAETLIEKLTARTITIGEVDAMLSEEVAYFIEGLVNIKTLKDWQIHLERFRGVMSWKLLKIWLSDVNYSGFIESQLKNSESPWYPLILTVGILKGVFERPARAVLSEVLVDKLKMADAAYSVLCFLCLICLLGEGGGDHLLAEALRLIMKKGSLVDDAAERSLARNEKKGKKTFQPYELTAGLISTLTISKKYHGIELGGVYPFLYRHLKT